MNFSHSPSIFQVGSVKAKVAFWEAMSRQEPELPAPRRPRAAALPVAAVTAPAPAAGKPDPIPNAPVEQPSAAPLDMEVATETLEVTAVAALLELADHKHWTMESLDDATPPAPLDVELTKPAAVLDDQKITPPESKPEVAVDASAILPHDLEACNDLSRTDVIQADQPSDYDLQPFKIPIDAIQQREQQCLRLDPTPLSPQQHEDPAHRESAPEDDDGDAQKPRNHLPQVKPLASTTELHQQPKQSNVPLTPQPPQTLPPSEPLKMKINQQAERSTKGCGWSWAIKEARRVLPNPLRGKRNRHLRQNHHQVEPALPSNVAAALGVLQQTDVLQTEGILRLSGRKIRINQLLAMDARKRTIKWSKEDVHDITGFILSKYRKAFEEGIIPESVWIAARKNPEDLDLDPAEVWSQLDDRSRTWLKEILQLGRAVVSKQDQNRMSASNVAMVLSPLALTWCFEPIRHMERLQPARELFLDWLDMVPWAA